PSLRDSVNVSYGRRLSDYPAVGVALLALRWLVRDLASSDVSMLLQTPLLGAGEHAGRARLELRLRRLPDRAWTPSMAIGALQGREEAADAADWLARVAAFGRRRRELPSHASPAEWALQFDAILTGLGWPGPGSPGSDSYQLVNRWRELLNEFARLEIVSATMSPRGALRQLELMAAETLFQPESREALVQLMGPLEAAGAEFDAVRICGMSARNWPPPGRPSPLVSRRLQREHDMPDATPENTRQFAATTLNRLTGAAPTVVCSYALVEDDAEQSASDLLGAVTPLRQDDGDPGWHAAALAGSVGRRVAEDRVPPVSDERIYGGAGTVQRQLSEPFSAFVCGRLAVRPLERQATGVTASLRGELVHDALFRLYRDLPDAAALRSLDDATLQGNVAAAVRDSLRRHERNADAVLLGLLGIERARIERLLAAFVRLDRERDDFEVAAVEDELEFRRGPLRLPLRIDRIDRYPDGCVAIIDYKTGRAKKLLKRDGSVEEAQLFVYAKACSEPVAALALANIDARGIAFSGAGRGLTDEGAWPGLLADVGCEIARACDELVAGDVRLIERQGAASARRLNLLSRYTELRNEV
ncbi:MAG: PD-(D/E)XK nuclease family protein, partial [Proteobacteria bacterium]|nr:PD-(D/E)XK nuclease family protein [Pseudomonadota bacterium]